MANPLGPVCLWLADPLARPPAEANKSLELEVVGRAQVKVSDEGCPTIQNGATCEMGWASYHGQQSNLAESLTNTYLTDSHPVECTLIIFYPNYIIWLFYSEHWICSWTELVRNRNRQASLFHYQISSSLQLPLKGAHHACYFHLGLCPSANLDYFLVTPTWSLITAPKPAILSMLTGGTRKDILQRRHALDHTVCDIPDPLIDIFFHICSVSLPVCDGCWEANTVISGMWCCCLWFIILWTVTNLYLCNILTSNSTYEACLVSSCSWIALEHLQERPEVNISIIHVCKQGQSQRNVSTWRKYLLTQINIKYTAN